MIPKGRAMMEIYKEIELAAIQPQKRQFYLYQALTKYMTLISAKGIALIYPSINPYDEHSIHWLYSGINQNIIENMLRERIVSSLEMTLLNLKQEGSLFDQKKMEIIPFEHGILLLWFDEIELDLRYEHDVFLTQLATIIEVAQKENRYFHDHDNPFEPELIELLQNKDQSGLGELLKLTQKISGGDIIFWGDSNKKYLEITGHLGSRRPGFGFELPVGKGVGGQAAANQRLVHVNDYKNSEYRYKEVVDAVDSEDIRTGLAIPIKDDQGKTSGVLYTTRRIIKPFSDSTRLLLLRMGNAIEPLKDKIELPRIYPVKKYSEYILQEKANLRKIMQNSKQMHELEKWLGNVIRGQAVVVDENGKPYTGNAFDCKEEPKKYSLERDHLPHRGELLLWSSVVLPLNNWPDFIEDVVSTIHLILEREERTNYLREREYSQWINSLLYHSESNESLYDKGIRLGLPIDYGEVWAIYWQKDTGRFTQRERLQLENVVFKMTKKPLVFHENIGFVFLNDETWPSDPNQLRDELLEVSPIPTWIVHSARYQSFLTLKSTLERMMKTLEQLPTTSAQQFVVKFNHFGLNYLLKNPTVGPYLNEFAINTFHSLMEYDEQNDTELTKTLALSLVYSSPSDVAKILFIHTNTVHYRVRKAKELLDIKMDQLGNDIALQLAAYTWLYDKKEIDI